MKLGNLKKSKRDSEEERVVGRRRSLFDPYYREHIRHEEEITIGPNLLLFSGNLFLFFFNLNFQIMYQIISKEIMRICGENEKALVSCLIFQQGNNMTGHVSLSHK